MKNQSLKALVATIVCFGILGAVIVAQFDLRSLWSRAKSLEHAETLVILSTQLGEVAHQLQKERGTSSAHLSSGSDAFVAQLRTMRSDADQAIDAALQSFGQVLDNDLPLEISDILQRLQERLDTIGVVRGRVDTRDISAGRAVAAYTTINREAIVLAGKNLRFVDDGTIAKSVTVYSPIF